MRRTFRIILIVIVGYYLLQWWLNEQARKAQQVPASMPRAKAPTPPKPSVVQRDDLKELDGIGPAYERALNALGIFTFEQLAKQDVEALSVRLMSVRVNAARIKREQWIEQAAARAASPEAITSRWSANDGSTA